MEDKENYSLREDITKVLLNWNYKTKKANAHNIAKQIKRSQSAVYECLRTLIEENIIIKHKRGIYILKEKTIMPEIDIIEKNEKLKLRLKKIAELDHITEIELIEKILNEGTQRIMEEKIKGLEV